MIDAVLYIFKLYSSYVRYFVHVGGSPAKNQYHMSVSVFQTIVIGRVNIHN